MVFEKQKLDKNIPVPLYYQLKELADEGGWTFELSLTHTKTTAAAVAVAYR